MDGSKFKVGDIVRKRWGSGTDWRVDRVDYAGRYYRMTSDYPDGTGDSIIIPFVQVEGSSDLEGWSLSDHQDLTE